MVCKITVWAFALLYIVATFVFLTGTYGWFSQPIDPLSAVFLLPLGLPWILAVDFIPEVAKPWFGVAAPLLNLIILMMLCRRLRNRREE